MYGRFDNAIKSFKKLKVPTKNSLFYSAASYSKLQQAVEAKQTLERAINLTGESIEQFLKGQNYEKNEPLEQLNEALTAI